MNYPIDIFFDIETLLNNTDAKTILLIGDLDAGFLDNYLEQKKLLQQNCKLTHIHCKELATLEQSITQYDVGIVVNLFENIGKQQGKQILSKLRDVLTKQYCVCLPVSHASTKESWQLNDLFSFALERVATYQAIDCEIEYGLFKYNINTYKKTPNWLNSDNWANPNLWDKYRW